MESNKTISGIARGQGLAGPSVGTRTSWFVAAVQSSSALQLVLVVLITLLAFALRLYKLGEWSFWGDEMITVMRATGKSMAEPLPRLSVALTTAAFNVWGVSEWSARISAAVIGALTVPIVYFGARRMFDSPTGLLAALFMALSTWHIYWSQNARFYAALLLFYTLALFFFYFGIEKDRPWYFVFSLGFLGLALMESLTAAFLVPILLVYCVLLRVLPFEKPAGLRFRSLVIFFGPMVFAGLYMLFQLVQSRETWQSTFWFFDLAFLNNNPFWILAGVVYYIGVPLVCMGALGGIYLLGRRDRRALLLALGAVLPLVAIMAISLVQYTANRYVFVILTSVVILAAVTVRELIRLTMPAGKMLALGVVFIMVAASIGEGLLYFNYQNGNRDKWKEAFAWIADHKGDGDLVITVHRDLADYYLKEPTVGFRHVDIQQLSTGQQRVWFVLDLTAPVQAPSLVDWFRRNADEVASMDVTVHARTYPMRIYLYDPNQ
jgi:hypothetical protein